MKTRILIIPAAVVILSMSSFTAENLIFGKEYEVVSLKGNTSFDFFRTHRQGKGVTATWGMATANDIVDFTVQRTYEDPTDPYAYWEDVAVVPNSAKRSFTYTDAEVFPGIIHYRIVAFSSDGSAETSEISSVRIRIRQ